MSRKFITDLEGPFSKDDNAFDLAKYFMPNGEKFFKKLSAYDDFVADIDKRRDYKAGSTLKMLAPFLIAYGANSDSLRHFSLKNIHMLPGSKDTLKYIGSKMESFIVSTSYEPYVHAVCDVVGFPKEHAYCTKLDIDKYKISSREAEKLKSYVAEINKLPDVILPDNAKSMEDIPEDSLKTIKRLDEIFYDEMDGTEPGFIINEINPVGGIGKADAILDILNETGNSICDVFYVGDSITDADAMKLVNNGGGLTVSVNGNKYAVREARIGCMADNTFLIAVLADAFDNCGKEYVEMLAENWSIDMLKQEADDNKLNKRLLDVEKFVEGGEVVLLSNENREEFAARSSEYRKNVRGEKVGNLG